MNIKKIGKILGMGIVVIIVVVFAIMGFIFLDVLSYTATGSETLNPNGTDAGKALIVYDPGLSGASKNVASTIASELQAKGYTVELAGIRSESAIKTSDYGIIIVGGPIYAGNASSSVKEYFKTLNPPQGTKVGVFSTGDDPDTAKDHNLLLKEAAPLPANCTLQIKAGVKIISLETDREKITDFVNQLLQ